MTDTADDDGEWSIHQVARRAGITTRTLRHYDKIGLLEPARTGAGGYRFYDSAALMRLQRILLLRELGLGLSDIDAVLRAQRDPIAALRTHIELLRAEQTRLTRQIAAVQSTIATWEGGEKKMTHDMFDGFDHTQYRDEVEQRWGTQAYQRSDAWWRALSDAERDQWKEQSSRLAADWVAAAESGIAPDAAQALALAERHVRWLRAIPGTPAADGGDLWAYVRGLAEMYVSDPRFAANYATSVGGIAGAEFVRDALIAYANSVSQA